MRKGLVVFIFLFGMASLSFASWCYQESANTSNQMGTDGSCGLLYNGSYAFVGHSNLSDAQLSIDGDWSTGASVDHDADTFINYTKPTGATNTSAWKVKFSYTGAQNVSINQSCWSAYPDKLMVWMRYRVSYEVRGLCHNGTNWVQMILVTNANTYEEAMYWRIPTPAENITCADAHLDTAGRNYTMNSNSTINSSTCFTISAENVTLDCKGFSIIGNNASGTYGIYTNKIGSTIKNCNIRDFQYPIFFVSTTNGSVFNSTTYTNMSSGIGIYMHGVSPTQDDVFIINGSSANASGTSGSGISIDSSINVSIISSTSYGKAYAIQLNGATSEVEIQLTNLSSQNNCLEIGTSASANTFHHNNFTSCTNYYVNDVNGNNFYNTTEGNIWANVLTNQVKISGNVSSTVFPNLYIGAKGSNFPYSTANSGGKLFGNVVDYHPLTNSTNYAPTALTPYATIVSSNYLTVNCPVLDDDGGTDIIFSNLTASSGTVSNLSNGTSDTMFWQAFNITSLTSSANISVTCLFTDASNSSVNATTSISTTSSNDSFTNEVQTQYATHNVPVIWNLTYSTNGTNHSCNYAFLKTDVQPSYNQVLNSTGSQMSLSANNSSNIEWDCNNSASAYTIIFSTSILNSSSGSISIPGLGSNAVRYNISLNKTLYVDFTMQATVPSDSTNRKMWKCISNSFVNCLESDLDYWVPQAFSESSSPSGTVLSKNYTLAQNETSFIITYDAAVPVTPPGGGGGSQIMTTIQNVVESVIGKIDYCGIPLWCDFDLFLRGKSFGLPNYWIWVSPVYWVFLVANLAVGLKDKKLLLGGSINIVLFMLWALGLIAYWPGELL